MEMGMDHRNSGHQQQKEQRIRDGDLEPGHHREITGY